MAIKDEEIKGIVFKTQEWLNIVIMEKHGGKGIFEYVKVE